MFKKILVSLAMFGILLTPTLAFAADSIALNDDTIILTDSVPPTNQKNNPGDIPSGTGLREGENLLNFISNLIKVVLGLVGAILLVLIIYGGFTYATAAGSDEKVKKARNILTYAIIGIVIIAVAWIATDYIIGNILIGTP